MGGVQLVSDGGLECSELVARLGHLALQVTTSGVVISFTEPTLQLIVRHSLPRREEMKELPVRAEPPVCLVAPDSRLRVTADRAKNRIPCAFNAACAEQVDGVDSVHAGTLNPLAICANCDFHNLRASAGGRRFSEWTSSRRCRATASASAAACRSSSGPASSGQPGHFHCRRCGRRYSFSEPPWAPERAQETVR